jgi:hypothetical protein
VSASPASFTEVVTRGSDAQLEAGLSSAIAQSLPSASRVAHREGVALVEDVGAPRSHHEGRASGEPSFMVMPIAEPRRFMADAGHPTPAPALPMIEEGGRSSVATSNGIGSLMHRRPYLPITRCRQIW